MNSFFTRFYKNDENVIYNPKDTYIYIDAQNCFYNYLSQSNILNIFKKENITFGNMCPFNYSKEIINHFKNMLGN